MKITNLLFRLLMQRPAIVLVNLLIVALILFDAYSAFFKPLPLQIMDLRSEGVSSILITWGVLLESRHSIISPPLRSLRASRLRIDPEINALIEQVGLHLLAYGLLLEVLTYFDEDARIEIMPEGFYQYSHALEWGVIVLVLMELLYNCACLIRHRWCGG